MMILLQIMNKELQKCKELTHKLKGTENPNINMILDYKTPPEKQLKTILLM